MIQVADKQIYCSIGVFVEGEEKGHWGILTAAHPFLGFLDDEKTIVVCHGNYSFRLARIVFDGSVDAAVFWSDFQTRPWKSMTDDSIPPWNLVAGLMPDMSKEPSWTTEYKLRLPAHLCGSIGVVPGSETHSQIRVFKLGATTGATEGIIHGQMMIVSHQPVISVSSLFRGNGSKTSLVDLPDKWRGLTFNNLLQVQRGKSSATPVPTAFCDKGDSGSLTWIQTDTQSLAVGLVIGFVGDMTSVVSISNVLDVLNAPALLSSSSSQQCSSSSDQSSLNKTFDCKWKGFKLILSPNK